MLEKLSELQYLLPQIEKFSQEIKRLNDHLDTGPQLRDFLECWRDTNIILGKLAGLEVKYPTTQEITDKNNDNT